MKQRKDQTREQRTMRDFALMLHDMRRIANPDASLRATAKDVWRLYPDGYASFESFYRAASYLALKSVKG